MKISLLKQSKKLFKKKFNKHLKLKKKDICLRKTLKSNKRKLMKKKRLEWEHQHMIFKNY